MRTVRTDNLCEGNGVKTARQRWLVGPGLLLLAVVGFSAETQRTSQAASANVPAAVRETVTPTNGTATPLPSVPPQPDPRPSLLDESAFRLVSERNIFNANRSGGQVRLSSSRRARVESFTLVGTLAYEKGAFAFFQGSNSELTKVLKPNSTIAGHTLVDILADRVKLEADGKTFDLVVGSAMRREDEGAWHPGDAVAGSAGGSSRRDDEDSSRARGREERRSFSDSRDRSSSSSSTSTSVSSADQSEALKRLLERREKESQ